MPGVRFIPAQGIQRTNLIPSDTRHNHFIPSQGYGVSAAVGGSALVQTGTLLALVQTGTLSALIQTGSEPE